MPDSVAEFYELIDRLAYVFGGGRLMRECSGRLHWPERGTYFFFEPGEMRNGRLSGPRVVRVGTHALKQGSRSTLWKRLRQHRGQESGGGIHRGSIFRGHVGDALQVRYPGRFLVTTWRQGSTASAEVRRGEQELERAVSRYISEMRVVWVSIIDAAGPDSNRGFVERNAIALLARHPANALSENWLGNASPNQAIRASGLWNVNHVDDHVDADFLEVFERYVNRTIAEPVD